MKHHTVLILLLITTSCSNKNSSVNDTQAPVITLTSPTNNQVFTAGSAVSITGAMTDNARISEVHVHVTNNITGALLMDIHRNPASASYSLNESFTAQTGIQYKIQVIAKDNSANEGRVNVEVSSN